MSKKDKYEKFFNFIETKLNDKQEKQNEKSH